MKNCLFCHHPVGSGTMYAVLAGSYNYETQIFTAEDTEGFICEQCFQDGDHTIQIGDTTYRSKD